MNFANVCACDSFYTFVAKCFGSGATKLRGRIKLLEENHKSISHDSNVLVPTTMRRVESEGEKQMCGKHIQCATLSRSLWIVLLNRQDRFLFGQSRSKIVFTLPRGDYFCKTIARRSSISEIVCPHPAGCRIEPRRSPWMCDGISFYIFLFISLNLWWVSRLFAVFAFGLTLYDDDRSTYTINI